MLPAMTVRLRDLMPAFAEELARLCVRAGRPDLAAQVDGLPIVGRCECGDAGCGMFYTVPPPNGPWGPSHENLILPATEGLVVVDVLDGRIVCVEVLDRDDVCAALSRVLSNVPGERSRPDESET